MGACNFKAVDGVSIGMVAEGIKPEEIAHELQEMAAEGIEDPTEADAIKRLKTLEDDTITSAYDEAQAFSEKLKTWIEIALPRVFEANDIEDVFEVVLARGYYSGFQLYVEWRLDYAREELAQCGVEGIEEVIAEVERLLRTVEFLLVDYAFGHGLGITSGGWRGGVTYVSSSGTWKPYSLIASDELIKDFKKFTEE